jgi:hypothetical protein
MQIESLKIFCDVARWASFSRAAAENGISPSSASQAVHQLELRLGIKLIERSKRPLTLTSPGRVYYEGCKEIIDRYHRIEAQLKDNKNTERSSYDSKINPVEIYFDTSEFSNEEIAAILALLSDLYRSVGGDALVIDKMEMLDLSSVLVPEGV